jgi:hypothetical protein
MLRWRVVAPLILAAWSGSCDGNPLGTQLDHLAQAEARWQAAGLTSYDFDLQVSCFCVAAELGPVTISVRNGQVLSVVRADSGTTVDSLYFQQYLTIDRMFATTRGFIDGKPAAFQASYDSNLGYPTLIALDGKANVADDEVSYGVLALRAFLPP